MRVNGEAKQRVNRLAYTVAMCAYSIDGGHVVQEGGDLAWSSLALGSLRRGDRRPVSSLSALGCLSSLHSLGDHLAQYARLSRDLFPLVNEGSSPCVGAENAEVAALVGY